MFRAERGKIVGRYSPAPDGHGALIGGNVPEARYGLRAAWKMRGTIPLAQGAPDPLPLRLFLRAAAQRPRYLRG